MKVLLNDQIVLQVDEQNNSVRMGKKNVTIPYNTLLQPGDTVILEGKNFTVMEYTEDLFALLGQRGAQIIDGKDASYMIHMSGIRYGSSVLESGTGSGALTLSILKTIGDAGTYMGVDHNEEYIGITSRNVKMITGMTPHIRHSAFEEFDPGNQKFDAIFLDLPEPWRNIGEQRKWVLSGSRIITYLPTMNQVEKTVISYTENGFLHLETVELSSRGIQVKQGATRPKSTGIIHTGYISTFVKLSGSRITL
jgi:tRNA(1-methyladenosine) methyltransferase and related methyltransferases